MYAAEFGSTGANVTSRFHQLFAGNTCRPVKSSFSATPVGGLPAGAGVRCGEVGASFEPQPTSAQRPTKQTRRARRIAIPPRLGVQDFGRGEVCARASSRSFVVAKRASAALQAASREGRQRYTALRRPQELFEIGVGWRTRAGVAVFGPGPIGGFVSSCQWSMYHSVESGPTPSSGGLNAESPRVNNQSLCPE